MPGRDQNDTMIERVDPLLGTVLDGKYRLDIRLASGGFGAIYRATHVETGVDLAVKVVHARLSSDPGIVARFKREGEALTALRSPHTITAYELGETPEGVLYIAMELLRGANLYERFRDEGPIAWRRMVSIALGVCHSLSEAHALGIVHRDLKPTNIHLERRGPEGDFVKVLDFGIAKILQHSQFDSADLTTAGLMIGTLDYMSPEQMVGGEITGATDLYTLGIVMYEMIAGKRPFPELPSPASVLAAMLKPPPPLSSVAIVPAELDRIVMRCLERDPEDRYQSANELAADLARMLEGSESRSRSFDPDDDDTQIAPRQISATMLAAAAPPLPRSTPRPLPEPPRAATLPLTPRRATPPPAMAPTKVQSSPAVVLPGPPPQFPATPPPQSSPAVVLPPPPQFSATPPPQSSPAVMIPPRPGSPTPPPMDLSGLPPTPINTLRGVAIPNTRDSGRAPVDATVIDPPSARREFDASRMARRDAIVRRLVWISVLVIASLIGLIAAARL